MSSSKRAIRNRRTRRKALGALRNKRNEYRMRKIHQIMYWRRFVLRDHNTLGVFPKGRVQKPVGFPGYILLPTGAPDPWGYNSRRPQ